MPSAQFAKFDRQFKQASCQLDAVTYAILRIAGTRTRAYLSNIRISAWMRRVLRNLSAALAVSCTVAEERSGVGGLILIPR